MVGPSSSSGAAFAAYWYVQEVLGGALIMRNPLEVGLFLRFHPDVLKGEGGIGLLTNLRDSFEGSHLGNSSSASPI